MCRHWHVFVTIILAVCLQWVLAPNIIEAATSTITTTPTESTNYTPTVTTTPAESTNSTPTVTTTPAESTNSTPTATTTPAESTNSTPTVTTTPAESTNSTPTVTTTPADSTNSTPTETTTPAESTNSTPTVTTTPAESTNSTPTVTTTPAESTNSTPTETTTPAESTNSTPTVTTTPAESTNSTPTVTTTPAESTNSTPTVTTTPTGSTPTVTSAPTESTDYSSSTDSSYFTDTTYSTIPTHTTIPPTPHSTPEPTTTSIPTTTPAPVYVLSGTLRSVLWKPKQKETAIIEAEDGYKISVKIIKCEIDGISQEFVTLSTDEPNEGFLFTYNVTGEPSYIFNRNKIYAHFNGSEKSSFTANFSIIGEATTTTTTEITTSTQFLPTPSINDTADITVFLSGKNPADYKDQAILNNLKDAIRKMTTEYCENNFQLADEITLNNVKISMISACHSSWPNYETCSEITFGVPVNQKEISQWTGYQLNSHHLKIMWDRYHEKYLEDLYVYDIPDSVSWVRWQIVLFVVVTLLFLTGLLALRHISEKLARRSKSDDTDSILPESKRNSEVSLSQHYLQEIPPLFENAYPLYNVQVFPDEPFEIADEHKLSPTEDEEEENFKLKLVDGLGESGA